MTVYMEDLQKDIRKLDEETFTLNIDVDLLYKEMESMEKRIEELENILKDKKMV